MIEMTAAQAEALSARTYREFFAIEIQNADGTWIDYSNVAGRFDFLHGFTAEQNVDRPVWDVRVELHREHRGGHGLTLAPTRSDSILNVDDAGAYAPAVEAGRGLRLWCAVIVAGAPTASEWVLVCPECTIDGVDSANDPMQVRARSKLMSEAADTLIEDITAYGDAAGEDVEDVIQAIADDWHPSTPTIDVPASPGFGILPEPFVDISVLESWMILARYVGYYVREAWDAVTEAFVIRFAEPNRSVTTPDHVFSPDDYFAVHQLDIGRERIRNVQRVTFFDVDGLQGSYSAEDSVSISRYGRRVAKINEPRGSPIDTLAEATVMGDGAVADTGQPTMDKQVENRFFWPAELGDFYRYQANGVHYNADQDLAVTGIRHEYEAGDGETEEEGVATTVFQMTGKPVAFGAYWAQRRKKPPSIGVLHASDESGRDVTGTTASTTLQAAPVPAATFLPGKTIIIGSDWDLTGTAGDKILRIDYGAASLLLQIIPAAITGRVTAEIEVTLSSLGSGTVQGIARKTITLPSGAVQIDDDHVGLSVMAAEDLDFGAQLVNAADTVALAISRLEVR